MAASAAGEFMEIQKPTKEELKRVHFLDEDEELTDREIWIYREYF